MIGYAVGLGAAVEWVAREWGRRRSRTEHVSPNRVAASRVGAIALGLVPLAAAPALVWGQGVPWPTSEYPAGWQQADDLMGAGSGSVMFLPWHGYQPFTFTGGRTVATPAGASSGAR